MNLLKITSTTNNSFQFNKTLSDFYAVKNESEYKNEYVIVEGSGASEGLLLKITAPVIRGVGITCEGGGTLAVKQEIIRLVSAALGVPVNRIWVTKMAKK